MVKTISLMMLMSSLLSADIWSKMIRVDHDQNQQRSEKSDKFLTGYQAGYQDYNDGFNNWSPEDDDFWIGYAVGQQFAAYRMSRSQLLRGPTYGPGMR
jgi:hypothetical protein